MKTNPLRLLLFIAALAAARADTLTLTDGRSFEDAKITSQTPTHVTIRHAAGITQVDKSRLPSALAEKYPIDLVAAEKAAKRDAQIKKNQAADRAAREMIATSNAELVRNLDIAERVYEEGRALGISGQVFVIQRNGVTVPLGGAKVLFFPKADFEVYNASRKWKWQTEIERAKERRLLPRNEIDQMIYKSLDDMPTPVAALETDANGGFKGEIPKLPHAVLVVRDTRQLPWGTEYFTWVYCVTGDTLWDVVLSSKNTNAGWDLSSPSNNASYSGGGHVTITPK